MKSKEFKLGELFCGPGGIACGATRSHSADGKLSVVHYLSGEVEQ